jgi:hypothetical protein
MSRGFIIRHIGSRVVKRFKNLTAKPSIVRFAA